MAHERKDQSTGSEKGHHDKHTKEQKQQNERKKEGPEWVPKGETNADRAAREEKLKK